MVHMVGFDQPSVQKPRTGSAHVVSHKSSALQFAGNSLNGEEPFQSDFSFELAMVAKPEKDVSDEEVVGLHPLWLRMKDVRNEARFVVKKAIPSTHEYLEHSILGNRNGTALGRRGDLLFGEVPAV